MVSPQKIRYNNIFSDVGFGTLDVILDVAFDSDNGTMSSYLNRSAVASESHDGRYKNTTNYKFDELFSPQFTIVKRDFSDFTQEDVRKVLKYLTSTDRPALLEVYYDGESNIVDWACIGGFTSIEMYKIANNRTVGVVAKFEAITPFAMSDLYTVTKTITSTDNKITINIDTDDNKPVYPSVTIKNPATNITFRNVHTDFVNQSTVLSPVIIKNNISSETMVLDGTNRIVSSTRIGGRTFGDDFENWRWLELRDGKNEITVEGNCEVTLKWRCVRKVGEW
jgi:hypothetical protein